MSGESGSKAAGEAIPQLANWPRTHAAALKVVARFPSPYTWLPARDKVFRAFTAVGGPDKVRVVIFGQDPYPRKESAVGLAFLDGAVTSFQSTRLAPSLRNIIKGIFIARKMATPATNADSLRALMDEHILLPPEDWFSKLATDCGVLWINTSLTFESKDQADLSKHLAMWEPVIRATIQDILAARAPARAPAKASPGGENGAGEAQSAEAGPSSPGGGETGVVFVLWGNKAQALEKYMKPSQSPWGPTHNAKRVAVVKTRHPAFEPFFQQDAFGEISAAFAKLKVPDIDWLTCSLVKQPTSHKEDGEQSGAAGKVQG